MAYVYAILGFILAGAAVGYGWALGGNLATASLRWNKKPHIAALVIMVIVFVAVLLNKVPLPF